MKVIQLIILYKKNHNELIRKNIKCFFIILLVYFYSKIFLENSKLSKFKKSQNKKRIGVLCVLNDQNAGNYLVKFAMFKILEQYNIDSIIISKTRKGMNKNFLDKTVKIIEINETYSELKESDYDILMVNSDQTWSPNQIEYLYDYGFLRFSDNWTIPKFIYAASMGTDYWLYNKEFDDKARYYLRNFTGISVREKCLIELTKNHLGIKPVLVLDPTFLIDKKIYLDLIKDFKREFDFNEKYLFIYELDQNSFINEFIKEVALNLNYKIYKSNQFETFSVENFLFGINISQAIITDSYHGTVFSIIFKKPFITFINSRRGAGRFYSWNETFNLKDRIFFPLKNKKPNIELLSSPLIINQTSFDKIKKLSLNFLEKNILIEKKY